MTKNKEEPVRLVVILRDSRGEKRTWDLQRYKSPRNFVAEKKGEWFEVKELESGNYDWFNLKFKLYYTGEDKHAL